MDQGGTYTRFDRLLLDQIRHCLLSVTLLSEKCAVCELSLTSLKGELDVVKRIDGALKPTEEYSATKRTRSAVNVDAAAAPNAGAVTDTREVFRHRKRAAVLAGLIAVTVLAVASYFYFARTSKGPINSVAVLPFVNLSDDPNMDHISDGITEHLINNLSQLPELKVIARSSAFQYKGKQVEPDQVARALGVRAIVTGRIAQQGGNLQISVELTDASDKTQMWGEQYHRPTSDLQAIQGEVARTVAQKLRLRLTGVQ